MNISYFSFNHNNFHTSGNMCTIFFLFCFFFLVLILTTKAILKNIAQDSVSLSMQLFLKSLPQSSGFQNNFQHSCNNSRNSNFLFLATQHKMSIHYFYFYLGRKKKIKNSVFIFPYFNCTHSSSQSQLSQTVSLHKVTTISSPPWPIWCIFFGRGEDWNAEHYPGSS